MSKVSGKVTKVESKGLYIKLENGKDAFLPKENMFIGKKKKLEEIFSVGFVIKAEEKGTKDSLVILTQKELRQAEGDKKKVEKNPKEKQNKKKIKPKVPEKKDAKEQPEAQKKQEVKEEMQEPKQETKTLKDLKKLQFIGNMKISVGKGKKSNITELSEEKEEKKEIPPAPEGLLEDIIATTKQAKGKFEKIKKELQERGYLDGH
ncbi:S1 RNA-binding domain-containing protein [uncultured Gemella sp.]|uniref:S1 RNA-binding domain-containing protein n=1 Tax=uncultured Gemella sp. TaxID=254352 RepID=UPI0028D82A0A|nr:S1 RNA-binding domain-containing protein [uncultured Gemella sp.]